jgi:hypothetical protein
MKRHIFQLAATPVLGLLLLGTGLSATANAENWIFGRSYYSHDPVKPVQVGRRAVGGPFYSRPQGLYTNSGFRNARSMINVGGLTVDNTYVFESWVQGGSQF